MKKFTQLYLIVFQYSTLAVDFIESWASIIYKR